ncbi:MAG: C45 family autoproteolytic acyltransferase/hydrolase [Planctomycetota bacterium]|jgi:hypothetical protein
MTQRRLPWTECPTIELDLDKPLKERYHHVPQDAIDKGKRLLRAIMQEVPSQAKYLADAVRFRTANRFHKEALTIADKVGEDWRSIMVANISYDLALSIIGCSSVALPTPSGPVLARNMDWWPEDILAQTSYMIRCSRNGRLVYANAGWPGAIGTVTGMSGNGFAIVLNAVISPEGIHKTGYPVLLHIRRVLEDAADFESALEMLSQQKLIAPALLTLVGNENHQRVVIERTPKRHALRWPKENQPLITTNDYRSLFKPQTYDDSEIYQTTCMRYEALCNFFADHNPDEEVENSALLYILSDPSVIQGITAQHVIIRPRSQKIRLFVPRRLVNDNLM